MKSMIVAILSAAEGDRKGRKVATPKTRPGHWPHPGRRSLALRPARFLSRHPSSLATSAHVDFGHAVGVAGEAHFVAREFHHTNQARAGLCEKLLRRDHLETDVPDSRGVVP